MANGDDAGFSAGAAATQGGLQLGIDLANQKEQLAQKRVEAENARQKAAQVKTSQFLKALDTTLNKIPPKHRSKWFKSTLGPMVDKLNIGVDKTGLEMIVNDEDASKFAGELIRDPSKWNDPQFQAEVIAGTAPDKFFEMSKFLSAQQIAQQRHVENLGVRKAGQAATQARFEENQAKQKQERFDADIRNVAKEVEGKGLAELGTALVTLDETLGGIDSVKGDIPGIGPIDSKKPDAALDEKGRQIRQTMATVRNAILKARSGGAVTPQEADRMLEELGLEDGFLPKFKTEEAFLTGVKNVRETLRSKVGTIRAGARPEVFDQFNKRLSERTKLDLNSPFFQSGASLNDKQREAIKDAVSRGRAGKRDEQLIREGIKKRIKGISDKQLDEFFKE